MTPGKASPHADWVQRVVAGAAAASRNDAPTQAVDVSWRRCLNDFKLDPARDYQPTVLDEWRVREIQGEIEDLVRIARAEMDSLYDQIAGSGYALLLADPQGVILCEKVDPTLQTQFLRAGLIVGAEWSERREGTNGIGTCAAEARPVTIHQDDHFRSRHIALSCSAAPIHDPAGRIVAVLDASCVNPPGSRESQMHTIALVNASARLIEKSLFLKRHRSDTLLRFHTRAEFVDLLHDGAIAVGEDGCIVASDITGLKLLGAEHRADLVGRPLAEIFDASYEELRSAARSGRRAMWELRDHRFGRRYFASLAEAGRRGSESRIPAVPGARGSARRAPLRIVHGPAPPVLGLEDIAGDDPTMLRNVRNAQRIADSSVSVLVQGPTGSGKEAFARALHAAGRRAAHAFVAVNCAAIPESLIESELFGYKAGAFTGARREGLRGRIAQASGGTLFLDEIGDMPLSLQTRLLRVLEEREITPLGSEVAVRVDLRVICASHRDLRELVSRREFREDLYYRLNGITVDLPALSSRRDKSAVIRRCVAAECAPGDVVTVHDDAMTALESYDWPGNFRELRNAVRAALAIGEGLAVRLADLPEQVQRDGLRRRNAPDGGISDRRAADAGVPARECNLEGEAAGPRGETSLQAAEREALIRAIDTHHGHMTAVAAELGISRNTLYRKVKRHGILITRRPE